MFKTIKGCFVSVFFLFLHILQRVKGVLFWRKKFHSRIEGEPVAYLIGTPLHNNIGDHAIALAEIDFINKYFHEYFIQEIFVDKWREYVHGLKKHIKKSDIIFITGGGNLGSIYLEDERLKRYIIEKYKNHKICIFPQTVEYESSKKGEHELRKTQKCFGAHNHLLIVAREKKSYLRIKDIFPSNEHYCCPDMAFQLNFSKSNVQNKTNELVGICLRNDIEATDDYFEKERKCLTLARDYSYEFFSTLDTGTISPNQRKEKVDKLLKCISKYKFVITDRLHGMIFSIISGVPCVAIATRSPKIISTLDWKEIQNKACLFQKEGVDVEHIMSAYIPFDNECFRSYYIELARRVREDL